MKILVTGAAGFIGSNLASQLLKNGHEVVGIDNLNDYYDPNLKYARLKHFYGIEFTEDWPVKNSIPKTGQNTTAVNYPDMPTGQVLTSDIYEFKFKFVRLDITDLELLMQLFESEKFDKVVHLAAQAGVRYSIENPLAYAQTNVVGFTNILECCRAFNIKHLIYASSSSVYGGNTKTPFEEDDRIDSPVSLYAATKISNELFAKVYNSIYGLNVTGLRFFTVYGPWGRPDMAPMLFARAMFNGDPIKVFNNGNLSRDFTYIDDIVSGIMKVVETDCADTKTISEIYNIGRGEPVKLMDFISAVERNIGRKAELDMMPMQRGDVNTTYADTRKLKEKYGYQPTTSLEEGIQQFIQWYKTFFSVK